MLFDDENPDHFTVMVVEVVDVAVTEVGPAGTEMIIMIITNPARTS